MRCLQVQGTLILASVLCLFTLGCGSSSPTSDVTSEPGVDVATTDTQGLDTQAPEDTTSADTSSSDTQVAVKPDYFPGKEIDADDWVTLSGLKSPVRIVTDNRGIQHIYGENLNDVIFAQGYITAQDRLFQMHTLRMAAWGRLGELTGSGSVSGDVFLRLLGLRRTAEKMAERTKELYPESYAALESFAAGANAYIEKVNAGEAPKPLEVLVYGLTLEPWTPTDTLSIVRLQTWDLGFGGVFSEDEILTRLLGLKKTFDGTVREGIQDDIFTFTPPEQVPTVAGETTGPAKAVAFSELLKTPFFDRFDAAFFQKHRAEYMKTLDYPHRAFRSMDFGSNNWVVSGEHTKSGKPLVANDTHLALRNPAVFYQIHLSTKTAGGDVDLAGVNFAGAPGITLGSNGFAAWAATVFYSDVTDMYVETLTEDKKSVIFKGEEVPLIKHEESFTYVLIGDVTCEDAVNDWMSDLNPVITQLDATTCRIDMVLDEVPHHGPIAPWTYSTDKDGKPIAMSWRWTGFEATDEFHAIYKMSFAKSVDDFKSALNYFGVGAQNWIYGDADGNILWYPSHLVPIRSNIAQGDYSHPPFLPMPGDGSCEWDGFVPRDQLPQSLNPPSGFLVTANADPIGATYDNDPFNDGPYLGHTWAPGFRMARSHELVAELVKAGDVTAEGLAGVQGDFRSNVGIRVAPHIVAAIQAANSGTSPEAAAELTPAVQDALVYLSDWDYRAASGVGDDVSEADIKSSVATSILNAFLVYVVKNTLGDEGVADINDAFKVRVLLRMLETPEVMKTFNADSGESWLWDDIATEDKVETRDQMIVRSLVHALAFLSDPTAVGPSQAGGFGTDDMSEWRWGMLHTVTLRSNVAPSYNIPSASEHANGYPRQGDNWVVDASHPGMNDTSFTFTGGPSIRNVYSLTDPPVLNMVIPGGQHESPTNPHYKDEMALWVQNKAPAIAYTPTQVLEARERILDLNPTAP